jgi:hypothetical protein
VIGVVSDWYLDSLPSHERLPDMTYRCIRSANELPLIGCRIILEHILLLRSMTIFQWEVECNQIVMWQAGKWQFVRGGTKLPGDDYVIVEKADCLIERTITALG